MKTLLNGLYSRKEMAEDRIIELKGKSIKILQPEESVKMIEKKMNTTSWTNNTISKCITFMSLESQPEKKNVIVIERTFEINVLYLFRFPPYPRNDLFA